MTHSLSVAPKTEVETPEGRAVPAANSFGVRLEFLDALRGIAALLVVVEHVVESYSPGFADFTLERFRFGEFGVVVFFLCSGFIIPASLERRGSLRAFWIGRFFRLYPLYWACLAAVLIFHFGFGHYRGLPAEYWTHWARNTAINVTMLQDFTGQPLTLGQSWTLAYELTFYVSVSVLFIGGLHRRSAPIAALLLLVSMVVGNHLASNALLHLAPASSAVLAAAIVVGLLVGGIIGWRRSVLAGLACALIGAAIGVALFNRFEPVYQAPFFLGTMFFGTALYRWTAGKLSSRAILLLGFLVVPAVVIAQSQDWSPWLDSEPRVNGNFHIAEVLTYLAAYAVFGAALLVRDRPFPRVLTYLGTISYSLYLVHAVVLYTSPQFGSRVVTIVYDIVVTIAVSALTYRFIERPAQQVGRRLSRSRSTAAAAASAARPPAPSVANSP